MPNSIKCIKSANDIEEGETYLPTESSYAYLDDEFVMNLCKIVQNKFTNACDIITCILEIEKIHTEFVCGYIISDYEDELISKIQNDYRNKNKKWLQHEKAYREFYELLNGKDVF